MSTEPAAAQVARYRDTRLLTVSGTTVNRDLDDLSAVFNHARREWSMNFANPVADVRRPTKGQSRARVLTDEEETRLIDAFDKEGRKPSGRFADGTRNPWIKPAVQLALATAMRRGELLDLRWKFVDLNGRTAKLQITKNGDARIVPLSTAAHAVLSALPQMDGEERVLPISGMALRKAFERACQRADIVDLHFHDLRHTAATRMSQKLPNVIELAAVTGHRDLAMLKRYYHPDPKILAQKLG